MKVIVNEPALPAHLEMLQPYVITKEQVGDSPFWFEYSEGQLALCQPKKIGPIVTDFVGGKSRHRRLQGGGKGQAIAKACGINVRRDLSILDATAGMGGDSFVLASLGATVVSLERNDWVYPLLLDGIQRLHEANDSDLSDIASRWQLVNEAAHSYLDRCDLFDVVYLDPMFPARKKDKAAVGKEMVAFHSLVGADTDADELFDAAFEKARFRLVVKRPKIAPFLADREPSLQLIGKSGRFDIYTKAKIV